MKRLFILMLTVVLIVGVFTGCAKKQQGPSCKDIIEACSEVVPEGTFDTWVCYGEDTYDESFDSMYGVQYDMISDGGIAYTSEGGVADEISIMYLKDNSDVSIAKDKLSARIEQRRNTFAGYKPEEVYKLDNAVIMVQGNYVALIISDSNDTIETEIRRVISEGAK